MNYCQIHFGDYAAATGHLTAQEHGIYLLLLFRYYRDERPIEDAMAARHGKCSRVEVEPILTEFFVREGDVWRHRRVDREIEDFEAKCLKNQINGRRGGRPSVSSGNQVATDSEPTGLISVSTSEPKHNPLQAPSSKLQEKKERRPRGGASADLTLALIELELPYDLDREVWRSWVFHRQAMNSGKRITSVDQGKMQLEKLASNYLEGHDVNMIIRDAIAAGWQGFFAKPHTLRKITSTNAADSYVAQKMREGMI